LQLCSTGSILYDITCGWYRRWSCVWQGVRVAGMGSWVVLYSNIGGHALKVKRETAVGN